MCIDLEWLRLLCSLDLTINQETIKVRRAGYPFRHSMADFLARYWPLLGKHGHADARQHPEEACKRVMAVVVAPEDMHTREVWQLGRTKIFIRSDQALFELEVRRWTDTRS